MVCTLTTHNLSTPIVKFGVFFKEIVTDVVVDIMSFDGTKNDLVVGKAVLVLNPDAVSGVKYLRKKLMQLASKMRFVSAPLDALLTDDLDL